MGGKLVGNWVSFSDHDTIVILEMPPSHVDAAAIGVAAGGRRKAITTTPLLSTEEKIKRAGGGGYKSVATASAAG
jgi:hypothetical protein